MQDVFGLRCTADLQYLSQLTEGFQWAVDRSDEVGTKAADDLPLLPWRL